MLTFVAIDLETTGLNRWQDEIIEIGLVRVEEGQVVETWQTFLRPSFSLPVRIKRLTGIKDEDLATAPTLAEVKEQVRSFIGHLPLVGHNVQFDRDFLATACNWPITNPLYDTLELSRYLLPSAMSHRLGDLCKLFALEQEQAHRALADAQNSARLLLKLLERLNDFEPELIWQMSLLLKQSGSVWHTFFHTLGSELLKKFPDKKISTKTFGVKIDQIALRERIQHEKQPISLDDCWQILGPGGSLAVNLPRFVYRPQQFDMVTTVVQALNETNTALVEAGTGTGKSLAYLIPAILWARQNGERVLVTTHTITLQEQLWQKDVPLLSNLPGLKTYAALLKGRSNYLCLRRWQAVMEEAHHSPEEASFLTKILVWLQETQTGDRSELHVHCQELEYWYSICSDSEGCLGNRCRYSGENCFYNAAKKRAEQADVIIVNHSLLLSDVSADNRILPTYGPLIIDEAHHLESCATEHLGHQCSRTEMLRWLSVTGKQLAKLEKITLTEDPASWEKSLNQSAEVRQRCREAALSFFEMLLRWLETTANNSDGRRALRFAADGNLDGIPCLPPAVESELDNLLFNLRSLCQVMRQLADRLTDWSAWREDLPGTARDLLARITAGEELAQSLEWICRNHQEDYVYWVEGGGEQGEVVLRSAPVEVGALLHAKLFAESRPVILTSATMAVDGHFKHFIKSTGLDLLPPGRLIHKLLDSPFQYNEQALLCAVKDLAQPGPGGEKAYCDQLAQAIFHLSLAVQGRTLVLFTSHRILREVYHRLKEPYEVEDICLLGHELDGSRNRLVELFKEGNRTVLFGAASFWEGVDIPGNALSCVIIVKLPFAPPNHPVMEAKVQRIKRQGRNAFTEYQLPQAIIKFKQGFGRLIRDSQDKGVVVVLDSRLLEKRYGVKIFNSLPVREHFRGNWQEIVEKVKLWLAKGEE
ncbi:helicase C-terminal domain-containing protein [Desulforamulus ferrireducens]|uniref:3'-5' exonuclease DinG n=1 Tax=Desulforamulus ferrireducens TaxID=1833852 RepID=A0A1S6IWH4_9FIRM|nr:helicase C-terminal domain-containing protein [Desulforamulus ferrireducens]AQS59112.1 DNA polymerase III subunit epsilon [Desulforamulus ferrireducens]